MSNNKMTAAQRAQADLARSMKEQRTRLARANIESMPKEDPNDPKNRFCTSFNGLHINILKGKGKTYGGYGN